MSISLETMLQLSIIMPVLAVVGIVATGRKPDLREGVTISTSLVLLYFVIQLYQALSKVKASACNGGRFYRVYS